MKKYLIVTAEDGFFAQGKYPWSSMDLLVIKESLASDGSSVDIVTFSYLKENIKKLDGYIIIYTSSQRIEHKKYIEDVVYLLKDKNTLIPSYEALLAHDNKGFQSILDKKYDLGLIPSAYFCDLTEIPDIERVEFPLVYKPANGASSTGVRKVSTISELKEAVREPFSISLESIKYLLKKYIFKSRYNAKWYEYLAFAKNRFLIQKFIPGLEYDYKVLIFGDKYFILKRYVAENDFKASGSGIHSRDIGSDLVPVLNRARDFKNKFKSHIYSLDICIKGNSTFIIEFQMTHVGPVTLTESDCYFKYDEETHEWSEINSKSILEIEFANAVKQYL